MKLNFKKFSGGSLVEKLKSNVSLLLLIVLGIVALLAGFVVYKEIRKISQVQIDTSAVTGQIVKVNTTQHQDIEQKLEESLRFIPKVVPNADVFGAAPLKEQ